MPPAHEPARHARRRLLHPRAERHSPVPWGSSTPARLGPVGGGNTQVRSNLFGVDLDGDGAGDVWDTHDAELAVARLCISRDRASDPTKVSRRIQMKGELRVDLPAGDSLSPANGLALRVVDALGLDTDALAAPPAWTAPDSAMAVDPATLVIRRMHCKSPVASAVATFRAIGPIDPAQPQRYEFAFILDRVPIDGQFAEPVSVTLRQGVIDRNGTITDCRTRTAGLSCREG